MLTLRQRMRRAWLWPVAIPLLMLRRDLSWRQAKYAFHVWVWGLEDR